MVAEAASLVVVVAAMTIAPDAPVAALGVAAGVVREAKGYGRQKGYLDRYRGSEYSTAYLPKVEIVVWVPVDLYDEFALRVAKVARTGRIGDGKVFAVPTAWPHAIEF